jgi:hypothetical protein
MTTPTAPETVRPAGEFRGLLRLRRLRGHGLKAASGGSRRRVLRGVLTGVHGLFLMDLFQSSKANVS